MSEVTPETPVRKLRFSTLRAIADLLDPLAAWRSVMSGIYEANGEPRYSQLKARRFEALVQQGKSPTMELLFDWGTSDCTVADLVQILIQNELLAAVSILLPHHSVCQRDTGSSQNTRQYDEVASPSVAYMQEIEVTQPVEDDETNTEPDSSSCPEENSWRDCEGLVVFSLNELKAMTQGWDDRPVTDGGCRLGSGGFGVVYRGQMRDTYVAVKKLNEICDNSHEDLKTQFYQEIQTLRSLTHVNVVRLLGCSSEGRTVCVVYEHLANGSLLDVLQSPERAAALLWKIRCSISTGAARGLSFLHLNKHTHRDIKSANILLDENFVAKISDFGLTRASANHSLSTVMTERIMGTPAYMAPEALRGEITPKSDIFSFGVVLLEIISGLPPVDEDRDPQLLMELVDELLDQDEELSVSLKNFVDGRIRDWQMQHVQILFDLASRCLCEKKNKRPTITTVLSELEDLQQLISGSSMDNKTETVVI